MVKEFKYTQDPTAETPIMFIDKEIGGVDSQGQPNIQGNDFLKELLCLSDEMGKKNICVWINSPGGVVTEGQSIYTAILESKAKVDTYCYGIAASIAGVIFQAGRTRIMADHSKLMYHPAWSEDGKQDKGLEALQHSICTMIAKRTGKKESEIWAIMNAGRKDDKGTWINAEDAKENGFCDEIRESDAKNKNAIITDTTMAIYESANKVYNRIQTINNNQIKITKMKLVLNKLGLVEDANEASAVAVIDAMNKTMEDLQKKYDDLKKKLADCEDEMDAMKKKAKADEDEAKAKAEDEDKKAKLKAEDEDKAKKKAKDEDKAKKAEDKVKAAVTIGKIKNDASVIEKWKNAYISNPDSTEELINELPVSKVAAVFNSSTTVEVKDTAAEAAAKSMGLKPGTAPYYNAVKNYELSAK